MQDLTSLLRAEERTLSIAGKITFQSGAERALSGDEIAQLTLEEGVDSGLLPGCVLSACVTLDLVNDEGQWLPGGSLLGLQDWSGATLEVKIGCADGGEIRWGELGVFILESAVFLESEARVRVKGSDSIASELSGSFRDALQYPATLGALWAHAIGQTRYVFSGNLPNAASIIDSAPDWGEISLRTALGLIAAAAGCFVRASRSGAIELCRAWDGAASAYAMGPGEYLRMERDALTFGPVDGLKIMPVGEGAAEWTLLSAGTEQGNCLLSVSQNPLYRAGAAHLNALAAGTLNLLAGYASTSVRLESRGDPALCVGDRISLTDTAGQSFSAVLTRQTLTYAAGFSASLVCAVPEADSSGVRRVLTPEGGVNAQLLVGPVNGQLLTVGSVSAQKLAAGSVTTEKLVAGCVSAEKLAAGAVDAQAIAAITAKINEIVSEKLTTDQLYAAIAEIVALKVGSLTAGDIQTDTLAAALATFAVMAAGSASFDFATVQHLVASALNVTQAVGDKVFINNLSVAYAQIVSATVGSLVLKGSDGKYYELTVGDGGIVTAAEVAPTADEIANGTTTDGKSIVETSMTAQEMNTANLSATYALINRIDAARMNVAELFARQAFIDQLIATDIRGNQYLQMSVSNAVNAVQVGGRNLVLGSAETPSGGAWALSQPVESGTEYVASCAGAAVCWLRNRRLELTEDANGRYAAKFAMAEAAAAPAGVSGTVVTIEDPPPGQMIDVTAQITAVQAGTGDPTLTNVRTISGWSAVHVVRCGKNLIGENPNAAVTTIGGITFTQQPDGGILAQGTASSNVYYNFNNLDCMNDDSAETAYGTNGWRFLSSGYCVHDVTLEKRSAERYARLYLSMASGTEIDRTFYPFVGLSASEQDFAPYNGDTYPISFADASGNALTVYGGTLDVLAGTLTVTHRMFNLAIADMNNSENYPGWKNPVGLEDCVPDGINAALTSAVCNVAKRVYANTVSASARALFYNKANIGGLTQSQLKAQYPNLVVQILLPLIAPTTCALTPVEIAALDGVNHLYADCGEISAAVQPQTDSQISFASGAILPKLERGNKATDWSSAPEDPAKGLKIGTAIILTEDQAEICSPKTLISVPGEEEGDEVFRADKDGIHAGFGEFDEIISDSVLGAQNGKTVTPASIGELDSLTRGLHNKYLNGDVTINAANVTGGSITLKGIAGHKLTISGGTLNSVTIVNCDAPIFLSGVTFDTTSTALTIRNSKLNLSACVINALVGAAEDEWAEVLLSSCTGSTTTLAILNGGSKLYVTGTSLPYGLATVNCGNVFSNQTLTAGSGSGGGTASITTVSLPATATKSWDGTDGWRSGTEVYQGRYGRRSLNRGCMWFDLTAISGKTIVSATLTIKRISGVGRGGNVTAKICGTTATGASGTPAIGTQYASVSAANGQRVSVDVTNAVTAMAAGSVKGLMLYDSSTANISSSQNYTAAYAKFYGSASGYKPVLTVTYNS